MSIDYILDIFRQGIWASVTGGWHYEPLRNNFSNVFLLYLWIILFILPLIIRLSTSSPFIWVVYCVIVGSVILAIKLVNKYLHHLFDISEAIKEEQLKVEDTTEQDNDKFVDSVDIISRTDSVHNAVIAERGSAIEETQVVVHCSQKNLYDHANLPSEDVIETKSHQPGNCSGDIQRSLSVRSQKEYELNCENESLKSSIDTLNESLQPRKLSLPTKVRLGTAVRPPVGTGSTSAALRSMSLSQTATLQLTRRISSTQQPNFCQEDLEALVIDVQRLNLSRIDVEPFEPSAADLQLLDAYPTQRHVTNSISRSRSGSARRSLRSVTVGRSHSLRTGTSTSIVLQGNNNAARRSRSFKEGAVYSSKFSSRREQSHGSTFAISKGAQVGLGGSGLGGSRLKRLAATEEDTAVVLVHAEAEQQNQRKSSVGEVNLDMESDDSSLGCVVAQAPHESSSTASTKKSMLEKASFISADESENSTLSLHSWLFQECSNSHADTPLLLSTAEAEETAFHDEELAASSSAKVDESEYYGGARPKKSSPLHHEQTAIRETRLHRMSRQRPGARRRRSGATAASNLESTPSTSRGQYSVNLESNRDMLENGDDAPRRHEAASYEDTSDGAVHYFTDEQGNVISYTFGTAEVESVAHVDVASSSTAPPLPPRNYYHHKSRHSDSGVGGASATSSSSDSQIICNLQHQLQSSMGQEHRLHDFFLRTGALLEQEYEYPALCRIIQNRLQDELNLMDRMSEADKIAAATSSSEPKVKHFYKMHLFPGFDYRVKVEFDRLALMALFDKSVTLLEICMAVFLSMAVAFLGCFLLSRNYYYDISVLILCLLIAASQFSLIKSVQPDPSSPSHGHNRLVAFSRAFYFCLVAGLILILDEAGQQRSSTSTNTNQGETQWSFYGVLFTSSQVIMTAHRYTVNFLLYLPLLFVLGLLPQVNTFITYILEQFDMHVFGGAGTTGLGASVQCVARSLIVAAILFIPCYGGIYDAALDQNKNKNVLLSVFIGILVSFSYFLSRAPANVTFWLLALCKRCGRRKKSTPSSECDGGATDACVEADPLPREMRRAITDRMVVDAVLCILIAVMAFAVHVSTAFSSDVLQPVLHKVLVCLTFIVGTINHYFIPQLRKETPWLCFSHPILGESSADSICTSLKSDQAAPVRLYEHVQLILLMIERNLLSTAVAMSAMTLSVPRLVTNFGPFMGAAIVVICTMKMLRAGFINFSRHYLILFFTFLFFDYDYKHMSEGFLVDYFVTAIVFSKGYDLLQKIRFIFIYIAPWQVSWGNPFHAFAQPFSVPHSVMMLTQAFISAVFSTPLQPFLGSAIFITSYVRPIKFWERDYNTKRADNTNTQLALQLERNRSDADNLNSIFYEHLTRSLQRCIAGDIALGRWGNVSQGDFFILTSDDLNAVIHIIEIGNGLVTFQLRGLEFKGTYCQQREVEAIKERVDLERGCCCCDPCCSIPHLLSFNTAFSQRCLAWQVLSGPYTVDSYSISDTSATTILQQGYDMRKMLIRYFVMSIVYFVCKSSSLQVWLENQEICEKLMPLRSPSFVDLDPTFNLNLDEDFDSLLSGISSRSFRRNYGRWIRLCLRRLVSRCDTDDAALADDETSVEKVTVLCFALSLLGRRSLSVAAHSSVVVEFFLYGFHALFKGDIRVDSSKDDWVTADVNLLQAVIAPAIRLALKLHYDRFVSHDTDEEAELLESMLDIEQRLVICHETDPRWRRAVLNDAPELLALRHSTDESSEDYKVIMLHRRQIPFRIVKINPECVRGLWAGQQQELVFFRNRNAERGSIQNAKQALRNIINSSCDQPIGYPIFVSPLTTSFAGDHLQLAKLPLGREWAPGDALQWARRQWHAWRWRCGDTCAGITTSNSEACVGAGGLATAGGIEMSTFRAVGDICGAAELASSASFARNGHPRVSYMSSSGVHERSDTLVSTGSGGATTFLQQHVRVSNPARVMSQYLGALLWPQPDWQAAVQQGLQETARLTAQSGGIHGYVVHRWTPNNPKPKQRSFCGHNICLVRCCASNGVSSDGETSTVFLAVYEDGLTPVLDEEVAASLETSSGID